VGLALVLLTPVSLAAESKNLQQKMKLSSIIRVKVTSIPDHRDTVRTLHAPLGSCTEAHMFKSRLFFSAVILIPISCAFSIAGIQKQDRAGLQVKLASQRDRLVEMEKVFLAPSAEDLSSLTEFLLQPNTGVTRLMPQEKYDQHLFTRGAGAFYSFSGLTHDYGKGADILLEQGAFRVGFAGANFAFLGLLGDLPLDAITVEHAGVRFLAAFKTPSLEPDAREQQRRTSAGFEAEGFAYRNTLPATVNRTYAVRSVNYGWSDLLIAFRVTRQDGDGSLILAWKILERFPVPQLAR